jgi:hypothetical protein
VLVEMYGAMLYIMRARSLFAMAGTDKQPRVQPTGSQHSKLNADLRTPTLRKYPVLSLTTRNSLIRVKTHMSCLFAWLRAGGASK